MSKRILLIGAALFLGAGARATEPCTPTTTYTLVASSLTVDGQAATTPTARYAMSVADPGGGVRSVTGTLFDPDTATALRYLQGEPTP